MWTDMIAMKQVIGVVLLTLAAGVLPGCPGNGLGPGPGAGGVAKLDAGDFVVAIEQDSKRVMLNDRHEARLARRPFTIILVFPKWSGVMVNASHRGQMVAAVQAGRDVSTVLPLPRQGLPENLGNPKKCIFVTEKGFNYWYYLGKGKSRFNEVVQMPKEFVCKRQVANFAADNADQAKPLAQLPQRELFLTFVSVKWSGRQRVQKAAESVKLIFD